MKIDKARGKFYLNWLGPAVFFALILFILPIHIGYPLNFMCGYIWAMALRTPDLKEKALNKDYRLSFLRFVYFLHLYSERVEYLDKLGGRKEMGRRLFGPLIFSLILLLLSPSPASLFLFVGAGFFEIQMNKYLKLGVDLGPLQ